jgi:hypothetical protein
MSRAVWSTLLFLLCTIGPARAASAQVYTLANMNTRQIQALDRQRTVILIPGGILEEHGPYLPSYTDGYAIEAYTRALATPLSPDRAGRSSCSRRFLSATTRRTR